MKSARPSHRVFAGRAVAVIAAILGLFAGYFNFGKGLSNLSYDYLFPFRRPVPPADVVIVALDEATYRMLGLPARVPLDRKLYAQLLDRLTRDGAKLAVFDILFENPREEASDEAFARAIRANGKVLLAAQMTSGPIHPGLKTPSRTEIRPFAGFLTNALGYGTVEVPKEDDQSVRRCLPQSPYASRGQLAVEAASALGVPGARDPIPKGVKRWINYYGPGGCLPRVSLYQTLADEGVAPGFFKDKVVFIGSALSADFVGAMRESFANPWTAITGGYIPGVEVHATMFLNLKFHEYFESMSEWPELGTLVIMGLLIGLGLSRLPPLTATVAALAAMAGLSAANIIFTWQTHILLPWLIVVALQVPVALVACVMFGLLNSLHEARTMEQLLALHVPASRARQLLVRPELLKPNAEQMEITIMFSDIANFSAVVQRKTPQDLVRLLTNYFESLIRSVHQADGTVIKLIGDSVFAVWNAPEPQPNHREMACRAALRLRDVLDEFDKKSQDLPLRTRIGLHTGPAFIGNFGSAERFDYTAIGDSVNLASRLEGLNEHLGTKVLASRDCLMGLESVMQSRLVGHFRLKGFDRVVEVHELLRAAGQEPANPEWLARFSEGLRHYQRRELDKAETAFRKALELQEPDGPSEFYLNQIAHLRSNPPPPGWVGEVNMAQK